MKTYILQDLNSNGVANTVATYQDEQEALKAYHALLQQDGEKDDNYDYILFELIELDEETGDTETIESIDLYCQKTLGKGHAYESVWNAEQQNNVYDVYFQGEKQNTTPLTEEEFHAYTHTHSGEYDDPICECN